MDDQLRTFLFKGRACREQGLLKESQEYYEQCLVGSWSEGNYSAMITAIKEIGNLHVLEGRYGQARIYFEKAIALARRTRDTGLLSKVLGEMGKLKALLGRFEMRIWGNRMYGEYGQKENEWKREAALYSDLGGTFQGRGMLEEAASFYSRSVRMARRTGDDALLFDNVLALSGVLLKLNKRIPAGNFGRRALAVAKKMGNEEKIAQALLTCARIDRKTGGSKKAERTLKRALALCDTSIATSGRAGIHRELGLLAESRGQWRSALHHLSRAYGIMEDAFWRTRDADLEVELGDIEIELFRVARAIGRIIELRAALTPGHHERVARLGLELAREAGLSTEDSKGICLAGYLHDLGKVKLSKEVLTESGELTQDQREILRKHPELGGELLDDVEFSWAVKDVILFHHERHDGSGYPSALVGEGIPAGARVLAIADVFDVLSMQRRETRSVTALEVLQIMEEEMRGKFDPDFFAHFRKMILEKLIVLEGTEFHPQSYLGIWGTGSVRKKAAG